MAVKFLQSHTVGTFYAEGETAGFDAATEEALVKAKIAEPAGGKKAATVTPAPPASTKPLAEQTFDELKATAKAEKVPGYGLIRDEAKLRAAIEKHRAPQDPPADQ